MHHQVTGDDGGETQGQVGHDPEGREHPGALVRRSQGKDGSDGTLEPGPEPHAAHGRADEEHHPRGEGDGRQGDAHACDQSDGTEEHDRAWRRRSEHQHSQGTEPGQDEQGCAAQHRRAGADHLSD